MTKIRPFRPEDYEVIAAIQNQFRPEPVTAVELAKGDEKVIPESGERLTRIVAESADGQVIGHAWASHLIWHGPHRWNLYVAVAMEHRNRGVGGRLYEAVEQIAREAGATEVDGYMRGEFEDVFAWAQRRGYTLRKQRTESVLDLTKYDGARFAAAVERVRAGGLTVEIAHTLDEALKRQIYDLDRITSPDVPFFEASNPFPAYDDYVRQNLNEPERLVVALAKDGDRVIGVSIQELPEVEGASAYTGYTGVYREYRGRGVALATKVVALNELVARGFKSARTNNDPDNPAMLAVNEKFGYVLIPGPRHVRKQLVAPATEA